MTAVPQCNIHLKHKVSFVHLFPLVCVCQSGCVLGRAWGRWMQNSVCISLPGGIRQSLLQMTDELQDHLHTSCCARLIRRKTDGKAEKSLQDFFFFDLIISWQAEHCENYTWQAREAAYFQHQLGGIFAQAPWLLFLLKCIARSDTQAPRCSLHFVPSV